MNTMVTLTTENDRNS